MDSWVLGDSPSMPITLLSDDEDEVLDTSIDPLMGALDAIDFDALVFGDVLGDGTFGQVYSASLWLHPVAVKILRMKEDWFNPNNKQFRKFKKEVEIMRNLRHPNILEFMGVSFRPSLQGIPPQLCIVTELMHNGNLEQILESSKKLSWKRYFRFAKDIACGLNWLHQKGIIHRDLKPSNLLISSNHHIKLADFGLSHMRNNPKDSDGVYSVCGTRCYIAPEVLEKSPYGVKADVFSFGVVLCEMINGQYPFDTIDSLATGSFNDAILDGARPSVPEDCIPELQELIEGCWEQEPEDRPSMEEIYDSLIEIERVVLKETGSIHFQQDDFEDLPDDVRLKVQEDALRLAELRSVVVALEVKNSSLQKELQTASKTLKLESKDLAKNIASLKRAESQKDRWVNEEKHLLEILSRESLTAEDRAFIHSCTASPGRGKSKVKRERPVALPESASSGQASPIEDPSDAVSKRTRRSSSSGTTFYSL